MGLIVFPSRASSTWHSRNTRMSRRRAREDGLVVYQIEVEHPKQRSSPLSSFLMGSSCRNKQLMDRDYRALS
jgi:hypothetical protein